MTVLVAATAPTGGTDWTLIGVAAVTGLTGILAGWFGYLGVRRSAAATIEIASREDKRQSGERVAAARERRAASYKQYLIVERRLTTMSLRREPITVPHFHKWLADFQDAGVTVRLYGTQEVVDAAATVRRELDRMWAEVGGTKTDENFDADFRTGLANYLVRSKEPRDLLTEAMRADTAASGVELQGSL